MNGNFAGYLFANSIKVDNKCYVVWVTVRLFLLPLVAKKIVIAFSKEGKLMICRLTPVAHFTLLV